MNLTKLFKLAVLPLTFLFAGISTQAQTKTLTYPNGEQHTFDCGDLVKIDDRTYLTRDVALDLDLNSGVKLIASGGASAAYLRGLSLTNPAQAKHEASVELVKSVAHFGLGHKMCTNEYNTLMQRQSQNSGKPFTPLTKGSTYCPLTQALKACPN